MIIALTGIDGSGKTTQAMLLSTAFNKRGFKAKFIYAGNTGIKILGRYSFYLSLPIDILINRILKISKNEFYQKYSNIAKIEEFLLFLNYILLVFLKIIIYMRLYDVVITDRYVYDYILMRMIFSTTYSQALSKILLMVTPKPTVLIVLDTNEEIAYIRKGGEKPLHHLKLLRGGYLKLAELLDAYVVSSDTSTLTTADKLWRLVSSKFSGERFR